MAVSRRDFLKVSGATTGGAVVGSLAGLGFDLKPVQAAATSLRIKNAKAFP
ncbi:MAG: twin-arginine translocation signal domain-containing protein [Candidatus Methylomirabilis oxyfera]|nr:twin-arginine translocation signal domain-containing protein [Candidatus Methylomirabilis oxyfera]